MFNDNELINGYEFWKHSIAVALFSKSLSNKAGLGVDEANLAYISGLMHDVGVMVFTYLIPVEYNNFLKNVMQKEMPLYKQELSVFGIDHAELGAIFISKWWNVDDNISETVRNHHNPKFGDSTSRNCEKLLNIANSICNNQGIYNGIECYKEMFSDSAWDGLNLTIDQAADLLEEVKISLSASEGLLAKK